MLTIGVLALAGEQAISLSYEVTTKRDEQAERNNDVFQDEVSF